MSKNTPVAFRTEDLTIQEHRSIRSLAAGDAEPHQQKEAIAVILKKFSRANDLLYIPGTFDETAFLNGRAFVGQQLLKYINLPVNEEV